MTAISADFGSLIQQLQSLESTLSSSSLGKDPTIGSFVNALDNVLAAGKNLLAANSAAPGAGVGGPAAGVASPAVSSPPVSSPATSSAGGPIALATSATAPQQPAIPKAAVTGTAHLLPAGSAPDRNKPDVSQFMMLTGTDFATAAEVLYGTIGSNTDLRDWSAIMASSTPLADARASTAALYNSTLAFPSPDATAPVGADLLGKSGNFEYSLEQVDPPPAPKTPMLFLSDGQGNRLRSAGNPQQLADAAASFGFDTSALATLQTQLDAAGINYRTGVWSNGFLGLS
jgi:hypothetical protein